MLRLFLFKLRRESMSLHYLKIPPYAPAFPWDSPEQVICSRYQRCRGCPYPSHGFLCWGRDRRMDRKGNPPPARPGTGWESAPYPPAPEHQQTRPDARAERRRLFDDQILLHESSPLCKALSPDYTMFSPRPATAKPASCRTARPCQKIFKNIFSFLH